MSRRDRAHRARSSRKNRGKNLDRADPGRLRQIHLLHVRGARSRADGIHDPHDHAANEKRPRHYAEILQVLADLFFQEVGGTRGDDERDERETQRVREERAIAALSPRERRDERRDAPGKINRQGQNRAQLNHDRIHFPKAVVQIEVEKGFDDAEMRG